MPSKRLELWPEGVMFPILVQFKVATRFLGWGQVSTLPVKLRRAKDASTRAWFGLDGVIASNCTKFRKVQVWIAGSSWGE
jgi:hypothetical protein